ncbi:MAG TPA: VOC family protein [Terriglobales bacterium]|nr:VOC family protein [Terriglobales bacterium]
MIGKLGLIMVVVKDMDRSVRFYRDVLGLRLEFTIPQWSQFDAGNIKIGLHPEGEQVKVSPTSGCTFGFEVTNIESTVAELKRKGASFLMEPHKEDFGWLAAVSDPDGYIIQIFQTAAQAQPA